MKYQVTEVDGVVTYASAFVDGELYTATAEHHPHFNAIVEALRAGAEAKVVQLFDVEQTVRIKFEQLTERVVVRDGEIYFDGDLMENALSKQIMAFLDNGVEDYKPLVNFFEKVMQNPSENSRKECFDWLAARDYTITPSGDFVAYKGVNVSDGVGFSTRPAPAHEKVSVDGELVTGLVPNRPGAVVEMPRSNVDDDLNRHCSNGLHVGTFGYAQRFTGYVLEVHVNPRDVVSVTADSCREKIRVCRYKVINVTEAAYVDPYNPYGVVEDFEDADEDFAWTCDNCGEDEDYCDGESCYPGDDDEEEEDEVATPTLTHNDHVHKTDTRLNYQAQQRDKTGKFLPRV